jgi:hypothetical protein
MPQPPDPIKKQWLGHTDRRLDGPQVKVKVKFTLEQATKAQRWSKSYSSTLS